MLLQCSHYNRFANQYLSGFLDITRGVWTSVRNSVRVTFCQSLVACSKESRPIVNYSTSIWLCGFLQSSGTWSYSSSCWFCNLPCLWPAASIFGLFYTDTESQVGTHTTYFSGYWRSQSKQFSENSNCLIFRIGQISTSELIFPRRDPSFSSPHFAQPLASDSGFGETDIFTWSFPVWSFFSWTTCNIAPLLPWSVFSTWNKKGHKQDSQCSAVVSIFSDSLGNSCFFVVCPISGHCVCIYRYNKGFHSDESIVFRLGEAGGQCMTSLHWPTKLVMSWEALGDV